MADWKIRRQGEGCVRCGRAFSEGEPHYSSLRIAEGTLEREDHCPECFGERAPREGEGAAGGEELFWWRTRRPGDKKRGVAVDFEAVEQLFLDLGRRGEPRLQELRYLLSLLLMRKRRLKLVRVARRAGEEFLVLRRPRRTEELEVAVLALSAERAAELRHDLESLFEGGGAPEPQASGPEDAEEPAEPVEPGEPAEPGGPPSAAARS